jgi:hypothetical protein
MKGKLAHFWRDFRACSYIMAVYNTSLKERGERKDYDLGVWVLCNQANLDCEEQDVSAETSEA